MLFFASLADQANTDSETCLLDDQTTLKHLYAQLQEKYGFEQEATELRVAINHEFARWDDAIKHGDIVAFIPPVAGG